VVDLAAPEAGFCGQGRERERERGLAESAIYKVRTTYKFE
jgi:hypothetical protein